MTYLIIALVGICLGLVALVFKLKQEIDELVIKSNKETHSNTVRLNKDLTELEEKALILKTEINSKELLIRELERQEVETKKNLDELTKDGVKKVSEEIQRERETFLKEIQRERETLLEEAKKEHEKTILTMLEEEVQLEKMIEPLRKNLKEYKERIDAFNSSLQFRTEEEMEKDFYRVQLSEFDKTDISYLLSFNEKLNNKTILPKLTWETYIRTPYNEMCKRVLNNENKSGIYKITDSLGKSYIGKSTRIKTRWGNHLKTAVGIESASRQEIHRAMRERGIDDFTFEVLEFCEKDELNEKEKYYINTFKTSEVGYNARKG